MIGYKIAVGVYKHRAIPILVTLDIPEDAEVVYPNDDYYVPFVKHEDQIKKLRTNKAKVIAMSNLRSANLKTPDKAYSLYELRHQWKVETVYKIGAVVESHLNKDVTTRCAPGIHFFETPEDAMQYYRGEGRWIRADIRELNLDILRDFQSVKYRIEV